MTFRLDPNNPKDRAFLEKTIDKQTGKPLMQALLEAGRSQAQKINRALDEPKLRDVPHVVTDEVMKFVLPYPPSTNNLYYTDRKGIRRLSEDGKSYKNQVRLQIKRDAFKMTGKIRFTAHVFRPRRRGDLSNRIKIAEDALKGLAWIDDEQVAEMHLYRHLSRKNPRIEITIEQIH